MIIMVDKDGNDKISWKSSSEVNGKTASCQRLKVCLALFLQSLVWLCYDDSVALAITPCSSVSEMARGTDTVTTLNLSSKLLSACTGFKTERTSEPPIYKSA